MKKKLNKLEIRFYRYDGLITFEKIPVDRRTQKLRIKCTNMQTK